MQFDLEAVLKEHPKGKDIMEEYTKRKALTPQTRISLVNILCAELVKRHGYYQSIEDKLAAAKSIIDIFPKLRDPNGKTGFEHFFSAEGGQSGYIQCRLKNIRRLLPTENKQRSRTRFETKTNDQQSAHTMGDIPTVDEVQFVQLASFSRSAPVESSDEVLSRMKRFVGNRMSWIKFYDYARL